MLAKKALGATAAADKLYIEDVYSTYLYSGTGSSQTITNNVDLSANGGLVWFKHRSGPNGPANHQLYDTARGVQKKLATNTTSAEATETTGLTAFNTNGFTFGSDGNINASSSDAYASFTFRKAEKFFDVVTYTGTGSSGTVNHNLGSEPGFVIIKRTDSTGQWTVRARRNDGDNEILVLNTTAASSGAAGSSSLTTTTFDPSVFDGASGSITNINGATYVAYLFAHDAGGFGDSGSDSVIKCGSYTTDGSGNADIDLGWESQWFLTKRTDSTGNWFIRDNMRGWNVNSGSSTSSTLAANVDAAETSGGGGYGITSTGIAVRNINTNATFIYIAIRRGPMKTPEAGTEVFNTIVRAGTGASASITTVGFPPDMMISHSTNVSSNNVGVNDKLRGAPQFLSSNTTNAESTLSGTLVSFDQSGFSVGATASGPFNISGQTNAHWNFRRAPGFFDVVCYTGNGSNRTISHNLGVAPELLIVKSRSSGTEHWNVYNNQSGATKYMRLNQTLAASTGSTYWNDTAPTSSVFTVGTDTGVNASGGTYVAYLFASLSGVSKIGSYSGNGSSQTINCGFTGGARFILIKRTDTTDTTYGNWYVWDSARGIVAGNDPRLNLNTTGAEVTTDDSVDTASTGFVVNEVAATKINTSGSTYLYLAIA